MLLTTVGLTPFRRIVPQLPKAMARIGNAELAHFNKQMLIHDLIRGSPGKKTVVMSHDE
jgi:hypothetical protein